MSIKPNTGFGPSITAARLYRKTSAKGTSYFVGRWGGVKVALLKSREVAEDGGEIWEMLLSEAAPYQPREQSGAALSQPAAQAKIDPVRDYQRPLSKPAPAAKPEAPASAPNFDTSIPF